MYSFVLAVGKHWHMGLFNNIPGSGAHLRHTRQPSRFLKPDSDLIFRRTLLGYYAEGMHANF